MMAYSQKIIIVPGYGMAVAQAQHKVWETRAAAHRSWRESAVCHSSGGGPDAGDT